MGVRSGYLQRPAMLTPSVGFAVFLAAEAIQAPTMGSGDGFIWIVPMLLIVNLVAFIPCLLGAVSLIVVFDKIPRRFSELAIARFLVGALTGLALGLPFAYVLNGMPSVGDATRFSYLSMCMASMVAGGFCAVFYSTSEGSSTKT